MAEYSMPVGRREVVYQTVPYFHFDRKESAPWDLLTCVLVSRPLQ